MRIKLLAYSLTVSLLAVLLYGYRLQEHPSNTVQPSTDKSLFTDHNNVSVTPIVSGFCTYTWAAQSSGTNNGLLSVSAVSNLIGWAGGFGPTVRRTVNGGVNWTSATGTGIIGEVFNIYAVDSLTAFCSTTPGGTFIYKTTNGGGLWKQVFTQTGGFINGIQMISDSTGYAVGDPVGGKWTILQTLNSGDNWIRIETEPTQSGTEAGWVNSVLIVGTDIWFGTSGARVYHSTDLGTTWSFAATPGAFNSHAVHFNGSVSSALGLTGGVNTSSMSKSSNGGISFSTTLTPGSGGYLCGLEGIGTDWWAIRRNNNVYKSTDQGTTAWSIAYTRTNADFRDIDFTEYLGCNVGWVVGGGGFISKMTPDGPLPVEISLFTSSTINNIVVLNWTTLTETNNSGFDIERSIFNYQLSMFNDQWDHAGNVQGNGTTSSPKNYEFTDRNLSSGKYKYRLKQIDYNGNFTYYNLSNEVVIGVPAEFRLGQNCPNPFNPETNITFDIPSEQFVKLNVYDISGRLITELVNEAKTPGRYSVKFNGANVSSGIYFYEITAGEFFNRKKMIIIK